MMKLALLLPPFENIYGKFRHIYRKGFRNPPLGFAYIAAMAEKNGHSVIIIDAESEELSIDDVISRVAEFQPDIIGLTVTSPTFTLTTEFAKKIKSVFPYVPIMVGGVHIAIFQKTVLEENPVFDFGIIGDGEVAVVDLLEIIARNGDYSSVQGLVWRKKECVIQNEIRPPIKNLDEYPLPARHLLKNELYIRNVPYKGYVVSASVVASRGCPYDCIYCAVKKIPNGTMVRFRSPQNIMDELTYIVKTLKIDHIMFNDDCLTFRRAELLELCELIKKSGLIFTWEGLSRADRVDKELLAEMKSAGLIRISFGIESGNQKILDVLQKHETLEEIQYAIQIAHEEGIVTWGSVIIGSPYETSKEVKDTLRFINSLDGLDEVLINIMQPYPGTKVRDMIMNGVGGTRLIKTELSELRRFGNASIEVNDLTADKLIEFQREGLKRFYCRPKKMIRLFRIHHPFALTLDVIGAVRSLWG